MRDRGDLAERFGAHVRRIDLIRPGQQLLVAVSGGLDSVVLLHLLRFRPPVDDVRLTVAHLDHGMRPGSEADARWVRGLGRAWGLDVRWETAHPAPVGESEARQARYRFLRRCASQVAADSIVTAHHADDQAETVLFRAVRGTGIPGLAGIRERGPGRRVRPLLPFWREELEGYARGARLRWRADPSNRDPGFARNVLRHRVLPLLEREVAPGVRRALVRLARNARREEEAWRGVLPLLLDELIQEAEEDRIVVARSPLVAYPPAVRSRLIRSLAGRVGVVLDEAGTRTAMEFTTSGPSGRGVDLPGGLRLRRDFDRLAFRAGARPTPAGGGDALPIGGPGPGSAEVVLGGRRYVVRWGAGAEGRWVVSVPLGPSTFPLHVRALEPGDRIRLAYGSKKLVKLFAERRVPVADRRSRPILVEAGGEVLWVPGLARAARLDRPVPGSSLTLGIDDADKD